MANDSVLVFSEVPDVLAEMIGLGAELRAATGRRLVALAIGPGANALGRDCLARGADEALVLEIGDDKAGAAEPLVEALREAVQLSGADAIVVGATRLGVEVAARLAHGLDAPCASDCVAVAFNSQGDLAIERRVYGGRFVARQVLAGRPMIATVPPNRFPKAAPREGAKGSLREIAVDLPTPRLRVRAAAARARSDVDVTKAEVIVAAGRGVKRVEDLALLNRLADALGGVLAGSRPLTGDVDWLPVDRRIGLSGQTVKPHLYVACGVSGQIEHVVGMKGARTVVAINTDPKAPIHADADYSIVGDLYEVVPALLEALAQRRP